MFLVCFHLFPVCVRYFVTSQMESTNARRVFPCFDEPAMRATFDVTLVRQREFRNRSYFALSNTPLISSTQMWAILQCVFVTEIRHKIQVLNRKRTSDINRIRVRVGFLLLDDSGEHFIFLVLWRLLLHELFVAHSMAHCLVHVNSLYNSIPIIVGSTLWPTI